MSPSQQLTFIPRCLNPQASSFRAFFDLNHDTCWPDPALLTRGWIALLFCPPFGPEEHKQAM
jgi:hypothetical protein